MQNRSAAPIAAGVAVWLATAGAALHYRSLYYEAETRPAEVNAGPEATAVRKPAEAVPGEPVSDETAVPQNGLLGLRQRIRELEDELARRAAAAVSVASAIPSGPERREPARERRNWMEELRKNDPAGYEELQKRREQARKDVQDSLARKAAYLLYRDTSDMSEEEQARHTLMLNLLSETWSLSRQIAELPREQRREVSRTLRENIRQLEPMLDEERDRAFYTVGRDLGYGEEESLQFAEHMDALVEITTLRDLYRGVRFGGGFGGPPATR